MKKCYLPFLVVMIIFWSCNSCSDQDTNKETTTPVLFGDPFIMLHDGTYYAYGTRAENGIEVYTSSDLLTWKKEKKLALQKEDTWASRWFWAPEVYPVNNKFYMYFSAEEHIGVAVSDSPLGPFVQTQKKPMIEEEKAIDNSLFIDDDGKAYLSFVRFNDGNNIWIAELEDDLVTIKKETMHSCARVSQEWETVWPRVNEGSFIVKHKNLYYLTYSANSYESPFYGVGYATATSPLGPWTKYEKNPILQNPDTLVGVGHSAMFKDKAGRLKIVFHAHYDRNNIHPRVMYIADVAFTDDETPVMEISSAMIRPQVVD